MKTIDILLFRRLLVFPTLISLFSVVSGKHIQYFIWNGNYTRRAWLFSDYMIESISNFCKNDKKSHLISVGSSHMDLSKLSTHREEKRAMSQIKMSDYHPYFIQCASIWSNPITHSSYVYFQAYPSKHTHSGFPKRNGWVLRRPTEGYKPDCYSPIIGQVPFLFGEEWVDEEFV